MKFKSLKGILGNLEQFKGSMSAFTLKLTFHLDCFECAEVIFSQAWTCRLGSEVQFHFQDFRVTSQITSISVHYSLNANGQLVVHCVYRIIMCSALSSGVSSVPSLKEFTV